MNEWIDELERLIPLLRKCEGKEWSLTISHDPKQSKRMNWRTYCQLCIVSGDPYTENYVDSEPIDSVSYLVNRAITNRAKILFMPKSIEEQAAEAFGVSVRELTLGQLEDFKAGKERK